MITAQAVFRGNAVGFVNFTQPDSGGHVEVRINIHGLSDGDHGIHVHTSEQCDTEIDGCACVGGHFCIIPGIPHGSHARGTSRHTGDLCNNITSASGISTREYTDTLISLIPGDPANIEGMYVVVHENRDDEGVFEQYTDQTLRDLSLVTGNAGRRLACAQIRYVL